MTVYAVPDQDQVQAKAQAELERLVSRIQELVREGYNCHVQISYTPMQTGCSVGQSFNFPAGADLRLPVPDKVEVEPISHWQAKDNSFRDGYRRGYNDNQDSRPYNDQPSE